MNLTKGTATSMVFEKMQCDLDRTWLSDKSASGTQYQPRLCPCRHLFKTIPRRLVSPASSCSQQRIFAIVVMPAPATSKVQSIFGRNASTSSLPRTGGRSTITTVGQKLVVELPSSPFARTGFEAARTSS